SARSTRPRGSLSRLRIALDRYIRRPHLCAQWRRRPAAPPAAWLSADQRDVASRGRSAGRAFSPDYSRFAGLRLVRRADRRRHGRALHQAAMAAAMIEVMETLGHVRFRLAGHDRGGRVAYRLALDHPGRLERLAVLDIVPTWAMWHRMDARLANRAWH